MSKVPAAVKELDEASIERARYVATLSPGAHIHISGICGTGTSAVLSLLKQLGYRVTGSDKAFYPPMGPRVKKLADAVYSGYAAENLEETPDLVVIGNALSKDNPEVQAVFERGLPYASMPEVFSALLIGSREECRTSIVVSGTHGKTTTTAALASILEDAGRHPGYFIGGVPNELPSGIRPVSKELLLANRVVVLEGDEYDSAFFAKYSKFHNYRPDIAIVTSLEFDHADIYQSLAEIELEFTRFVRRIPSDGMILVCDQGDSLAALADSWEKDPLVQATVLRYGLAESSDYQLLSRTPWQYQDIPEKRIGQRLRFLLSGHEMEAKTTLSGQHNALNLLVCAAVARRLGVGDQELGQGIQNFTGVQRRQQILLEIAGITVIEDFAHHPSAVTTTLSGLKEAYPEKRLVAVFEPRSNTSRRGYFQEEYGKSFQSADLSVLREVQDAGSYSSTEDEIVALDVAQVKRDIKEGGGEAKSFAEVDAIRKYLLDELRSGDLVVLMSNGDFDGLSEILVNALKRKHS